MGTEEFLGNTKTTLIIYGLYPISVLEKYNLYDPNNIKPTSFFKVSQIIRAKTLQYHYIAEIWNRAGNKD